MRECVYVLVREWQLDVSPVPLGLQMTMCFCIDKTLIRFLFYFFTMALMNGAAGKSHEERLGAHGREKLFDVRIRQLINATLILLIYYFFD